MSFTLDGILTATGGQLLHSGATEFSKFGTDTRKDLSGQIFVALKGEAHDAHDFLNQALDKGASGLLVHRWGAEQIELIKKFPHVSVVLVKDTLQALQEIAKSQRQKLGNTVISITGSNGKTTTKEFLAQIVGRYRRTHFNEGSFNNHWGVPFTILEQAKDTQILVSEIGMNHAGEITQLVGIADPDIVVCTTVGRAHIEHFGTVEKIAKAKEEIYTAAKPSAQRIYNIDNVYTREMFQRAGNEYPQCRRFWTFSEQMDKADVHLKLVKSGWEGLEIEGQLLGIAGAVKVPVFGGHNLTNLMAAAACGLAAGLTPQEVWAQLPEVKTAWGRNQILKTESGATILFDGYNANPDSMAALMTNTEKLKSSGNRIFAVLGQMRELGDHAQFEHESLGRKAASLNFEQVYFFGENSADFARGYESEKNQKNIVYSNTYEDSLAIKLASVLRSGDVVIVKASRGMRLERFVKLTKPIGFKEKK